MARFDCVQMTTHDIAQPSLRPVTHRGPADVATSDKGKATNRQQLLGLTDYIQDKQRMLPAPAALPGATDVGRATQAR